MARQGVSMLPIGVQTNQALVMKESEVDILYHRA